LLQSTAEMSVVAEADSGEAACQLYLELKPDVVVMDLACRAWAASRHCGEFAPADARAQV